MKPPPHLNKMVQLHHTPPLSRRPVRECSRTCGSWTLSCTPTQPGVRHGCAGVSLWLGTSRSSPWRTFQAVLEGLTASALQKPVVRQLPQDPDFRLTFTFRREGSSPAFSAGWSHDKVWSYTCSDSYHDTVIAASAANAALPLFHAVCLLAPDCATRSVLTTFPHRAGDCPNPGVCPRPAPFVLLQFLTVSDELKPGD
jgi:hypothetical protein